MTKCIALGFKNFVTHCYYDRSTPDYLIWLKYISWFFYGNEILVVNQWEDVTQISTCDLSA